MLRVAGAASATPAGDVALTVIHHRNTDPERAAIEWHDSELVALTDQHAALILDLRAVVHRSHGEPGTDAGTVWLQPAAVVLSNGRRDGPRFVLPCDINVGRVETDCYDYGGMIPCPFSSNGRSLLELTLSSGEWLRVEADQLTVTVTGEPEFLEDFVPEGHDEEEGS
jgi:hypothetical protein